MTSWWSNHPFQNVCQSGSSSQVGIKIKHTYDLKNLPTSSEFLQVAKYGPNVSPQEHESHVLLPPGVRASSQKMLRMGFVLLNRCLVP